MLESSMRKNLLARTALVACDDCRELVAVNRLPPAGRLFRCEACKATALRAQKREHWHRNKDRYRPVGASWVTPGGRRVTRISDIDIDEFDSSPRSD